MLKIVEGNTVVLGLSDADLKALAARRSIEVKGESCGLPGKRIFLLSGGTDEALERQMTETWRRL